MAKRIGTTQTLHRLVALASLAQAGCDGCGGSDAESPTSSAPTSGSSAVAWVERATRIKGTGTPAAIGTFDLPPWQTSNAGGPLGYPPGCNAIGPMRSRALPPGHRLVPGRSALPGHSVVENAEVAGSARLLLSATEDLVRTLPSDDVAVWGGEQQSWMVWAGPEGLHVASLTDPSAEVGQLAPETERIVDLSCRAPEDCELLTSSDRHPSGRVWVMGPGAASSTWRQLESASDQEPESSRPMLAVGAQKGARAVVSAGRSWRWLDANGGAPLLGRPEGSFRPLAAVWLTGGPAILSLAAETIGAPCRPASGLAAHSLADANSVLSPTAGATAEGRWPAPTTETTAVTLGVGGPALALWTTQLRCDNRRRVGYAGWLGATKPSQLRPLGDVISVDAIKNGANLDLFAVTGPDEGHLQVSHVALTCEAWVEP